MVKEINHEYHDNGLISEYQSNRINKSFIVVEYDHTSTMNIFEKEKEDIARKSLEENDSSCQERAGVMENVFYDEDEEYIFFVFGALYEATNGDIKKSIEILCDNFPYHS